LNFTEFLHHFLKFLIGFRHPTSAAFQWEKEHEIPLVILSRFLTPPADLGRSSWF